VEQKAERACEPDSERAKEQAGTIDPGMESVKAEAVAGEGKAVTSERFRYEEESCGAPQREEAEIGKNGFRGAGRQGARRFGTRCSERLHARGTRETPDILGAPETAEQRATLGRVTKLFWKTLDKPPDVCDTTGVAANSETCVKRTIFCS
jgi:hypothetical protein